MRHLQLSIRHLRRILPIFVVISTITNVANLTIRVNEYVNPHIQQITPPLVCQVLTETK